MDRLLKIQEAADILRCSKKTAVRIMRENDVPILPLGERTIRVKESEIENLVERLQTCPSKLGVSRTSSMLKSVRSELEKQLGVPARKPVKLKVISDKNS